MTKQEVIEYFGSQQAVADALGIKQPSVAGWGDSPPGFRQIQLQIITNGALIVDDGVIPARIDMGAK